MRFHLKTHHTTRRGHRWTCSLLAACAVTGGILHADELQVCTTYQRPIGALGLGLPIPLQQFDPSLGQPVKFDLSLTGHCNATLGLENRNAFTFTPWVNLGGFAVIRRPDGTSLMTATMLNPFTQTFPVFDGTVDFGGASGATTNSVTTGVAMLSIPVGSPDSILFVGTQPVPLTLDLGGVASHGPIGPTGSHYMYATLAQALEGADIQLCCTYRIAGVPYCFGDGTGTACPCGTVSASGNGCPSSIAVGGSNLSGQGFASISSDTLVLNCTSVPNGPGLFYQGSAQTAVAFGDGVLCAGSGIQRLGVVFANGNHSSYPGGLTPNPVHIAGATSAGDQRHYQMWYRDADVSFCTASLFNLTNGLSVLWAP